MEVEVEETQVTYSSFASSHTPEKVCSVAGVFCANEFHTFECAAKENTPL